MDSAQKDLARAIEAGDAPAQVEANKRIATLAFDNAKLEQANMTRKMLNFLTVESYQDKLPNIYLNNQQFLKRNPGQVKINGSVKTER